MTLPLEEKVALVTGGAIRVGSAIARRLAAAGCDVVLHYRNSTSEAIAFAEELRALGRQVWPIQGDLAEDDEPEAIMKTAWEMAGWIDLLINNASTYSRNPLIDAEPEDFELHWRVNALAPMLLTKAFQECAAACEILPRNYRGQVINILDRCVASPDSGALPYWVSKCALAAFTKGAARELAPRIVVNGVAPGPVLAPASETGEGVDRAGTLPLETPCTPDDVAEAVLYLAASTAITGQIIYIDSGQHLFH